MSINRVVLIGRLAREPDLRYTQSGIANCTFTLAVDRPFKNGNDEREADFIPIVTWRGLAESCANYLAKGRLTAVEGRIQVRNYEGNDGQRRYVTEVIADNVRFLEHKDRQQDRPSNETSNDPFKDDGRPIDISEDDLPF